jgi:AcrR family transcriptional regulator
MSRAEITERTRRRTPTPRQTDLLNRLEGLFLAEGFATFTLDDLAARLRCSKSTLYALAPSKEQLSVQVVSHFFKKATTRIEQRISELTDVRARISGYFAAAADELRPASREFIADIAAFPPARATYELNARAAAARIRALIADGVRLGEFRDVHAAMVSEMVGLTIENIHLGVIAKRTGLSDAEAFEALSEFLLGGLAPTS